MRGLVPEDVRPLILGKTGTFVTISVQRGNTQIVARMARARPATDAASLQPPRAGSTVQPKTDSQTLSAVYSQASSSQRACLSFVFACRVHAYTHNYHLVIISTQKRYAHPHFSAYTCTAYPQNRPATPSTQKTFHSPFCLGYIHTTMPVYQHLRRIRAHTLTYPSPRLRIDTSCAYVHRHLRTHHHVHLSTFSAHTYTGYSRHASRRSGKSDHSRTPATNTSNSRRSPKYETRLPTGRHAA